MTQPIDYVATQLDRIEAKLDQVLTQLTGTPPVPVPVPPPGPTPNPVPSAKYPSDVLDLRNWTIMLPTGGDGDPDNLYLVGKSLPDVFYLDPTDGAVVFRCPPDGVHSSGSKYPRTEARQMADNKWTKAAWSSSGSHTLECDLAIDTSHLSTRRRIVAMQIHDGGDDVCQLMYREDGKLGLAHNDGDSFEIIDPGYVNAARFVCRIEADSNRIRVFYNNVKRVDIAKSGTGWYWKFGSYLQTGGASDYNEPAGAYGQVKVWRYTLTGGAS